MIMFRNARQIKGGASHLTIARPVGFRVITVRQWEPSPVDDFVKEIIFSLALLALFPQRP